VTVFHLDGMDVGSRVLAALARESETDKIVLSCCGATFRERVEWEGVTFAQLDATGAAFEQGMAMSSCTVSGDAFLDRVSAPLLRLDRVVFEAAVYARGAQVTLAKLDDVEFRGYASFDEARLNQATFRGVSFSAEARFRQLACTDLGNLRHVAFRTVASFQESRWGGLRFAGCKFDGPVQIGDASVRQRLSFVGCRLRDSRTLELSAGEACELRETSFEQPLNLRVSAPRVEASHASFELGVDLVLSPGAKLDLEGASLSGPSLIMTAAVPDAARARLGSLMGTRLAGLTLRGLDLTTCSFALAHTLDDVVISGRGQLSRAPWARGWIGQREVIVDEIDYWRGSRPRRRTGLVTAGSDEPGHASTLAETYRALRRGRENAKDRPGAADFYYGEMEMRRRSAPAVDRVVLGVYWLVGGYGLRASRALLAYLLLVGSLAVALTCWGLSVHAPFSEILVYVLATTTVLQKPSPTLHLTVLGSYLQVAARLIGPAMFALILLALRSRVRR
jgi:uncharacterized protein YjbI with pentapeptide repeats